MTVEAIIFDFDGVIADSEGLACEVLARYVTELGVAMPQRQAMEQFTGKRLSDVTAMVEQLVGSRLPDFADELQHRTLRVFETDLREVAGVGRFLESHQNLHRCIASSSTPARIRFSLSVLKLDRYFGNNIFSADQVARGKPHPDIFLYAASEMKVANDKVVVIEDSPGGVQAAVAADMRVIGLLAATHLPADHAGKLRTAGATLIAGNYDEVSRLISGL
jgi:HAD superfamily hydrolase (TIGR01509 family)